MVFCGTFAVAASSQESARYLVMRPTSKQDADWKIPLFYGLGHGEFKGYGESKCEVIDEAGVQYVQVFQVTNYQNKKFNVPGRL